MNFNEIREKYKNFIYKDYKIFEDDNKIYIEFKFEIENLSEFSHKIEILKKNFKFKDIHSNNIKNIIFNLGMVEAISYFKLTCSKNFIIKCGYLNLEQQNWFKKLFYFGLGEFRYINNINVEYNDFIKYKCIGNPIKIENIEDDLNGIIVPVGGGKDSIVTMELLKDYNSISYAFCIGSKKVSMECANIAGFENERIIEVNRLLDKKLIDLNNKGFFNGHTPFSATVAFLTYLVSFLLGKKYVVLSNEDSANESNVIGDNINHQYSKTIEFENDFRFYAQKYLKSNVEYFSILRPIKEIQIAMLFSNLEKYHKVFKSCNVGSKTEPWRWCAECPKCLFVFIILSPFLYKDKLLDIFGKNLYENEKLLKIFIELCGYGDNKPFECVGTYEEINYALIKTINKCNVELPFLLKYYKDNFINKNILKYNKNQIIEYDDSILGYYNNFNNLPKEFDNILKNKIRR